MKAKGPGQSALLLLDVIDILSKRRIPYAIVGAFAASFYGVVRASLDADVIVSLSSSRADVEALLGEFRKAGFKGVYRKGESGDPVGAVVNVEDQFKNRVDLFMGIRGVTEDVFSRTVETEFVKTKIRLIGIEDFIAMKIFAGGPRDLGDVAGVLKVSCDRIDRGLLRTLVQKYGRGALEKLGSLLERDRGA